MRISEEEFAGLPAYMTRTARNSRSKQKEEPEHLRMAGATAGAAGSSKAKTKAGGMQAMQALGRLEAGELNKTEEAYRAHLEQLRMAGEIVWYQFEPFKLLLAPKTTYTPDFLVQLASGHLEVHEVKGYWMDDARVKIKVAASMFPVFKFIAIKKAEKPKRGTALGPDWVREEF